MRSASTRKGLFGTTTLLIVGLVLVVLVGAYFFFLHYPQMTPEEKAKAFKALQTQLRPIKTKVCVGEESIFELTVVNPITNPKVYMQLTLEAPPGVTVYAGQGVKGGSGLVTTSTVLEPGEAKTIRIRIIAVEPGQKIVSGSIFYWFEGENKQDARRIDLDFPVTILNCKK